MKKKDIIKRIEDGFSELSPDLFEAVLEESRKQEVVWAKSDVEESSGNGKFYTGRFPRYALSLCASLAIICLCIFGMLGQKEKSVYMVLDINPSIQIEMNEEHQVKRLKGLNQDGRDVVRELKWKKMESVQVLLDVLIQDVVEKSYLRENEGILVTLTAPDKDICEKLERTLGDGIDRKLTELKVSGVTTAFQEAQDSSQRQGRKLLEAELTKNCGMDEKQVEQMSVGELIQYCQDYTSLELKLSAASEKGREEQKKNGDGSQTQPDSQQKESGQDSKDKAGESGKKPKKDDKKPADKKPDGENNNPKDDKQDIEGNTDKQEIDNSAGSKTQMEDVAPSNAGKPIQSGSDAAQETGGASGQMTGAGDPDTENTQTNPGSSGAISQGGHQAEPGGGGALETGDLPIQPGNGGSQEPGNTQTNPGDSGGTDGSIQTNPKGDAGVNEGNVQTDPKGGAGIGEENVQTDPKGNETTGVRVLHLQQIDLLKKE